MDKGSVISVIEETNLKGWFRARMDYGLIILVSWVRNYIGVAQILEGRMIGYSGLLKQRFTWGGFDTWCMNVLVIDNVREKLNLCC